MSRPFHVERVFLGWEGPLLPRTSRWLLERAGGSQGPPDLERLLVVTPGRRAGRRLLEHLVHLSVSRGGLVPPPTGTLGSLAELLFTPEAPLAGALESRLQRAEALRRAERDLVGRIVAEPPAFEDLAGWLALACELERVEEELAVEAYDPPGAVRLLERVAAAAGVEAAESERWEALVTLAERARQRLATTGKELAQAFRLRAASGRARRSRLELDGVVLVGLSEVPRIFRRLLEARGVAVTALIMAPSSEADAFDAWGTPRSDRWPQRRLELLPGVVEVADRPSDQTGVAVERVLGWGGGVGSAPITVGVADPGMAATLVDQLARVGVSGHAPETRSLGASLPALTLSALARYVAGRRLADLIALARLPPVERWVDRCFADVEEAARPPDDGRRRSRLQRELAAGRWLAALDRFAADSATDRVDRPLGGELAGRDLVRRADRAVLGLFDEEGECELEAGQGGGGLRSRRPPSGWAAPIARALGRLFEADPEQAGSGEARRAERTLEALTAIGVLLRELVGIPEEQGPAIALEEAVALLLRSLGESAPPAEGVVDPAVEVLGWLELALDDAPDLVVVGLNEGVVPAAIPVEPFLSEGVRRALGLLDDRRRLSRDLFLLTTLVRSRRRLCLVAGRRTSEGEPLAPSRLLLARDPQELPRVVSRFFDRAPRAGVARDLVEWPEASAFPIPRPHRVARLEGLPVTAFRDYLACPYRFFLRHVLELEAARDAARELDPATFGRLAHTVLQRFAQGPAADSSDPEAVSAALLAELDRVAAELLGSDPVVAARVQVAQLRRRLEVFASWQADQSRQGWRIEHVETRLEAPLLVDGEPFAIRGQLDRVDVHESGIWRIVDFKTGDSPKTPEASHCRKPRGAPASEWVDLQLPLYRVLARSAALGPSERAAGEREPVLAFYSLSKKLSVDGYSEADWTPAELDEAEERARDVVRSIRSGVFWPPADPPAYDDGYGWIAGDTLADRARLLAGEAHGEASGEPSLGP